MKKIFKSLMLGLAIIPTSFMFVACGPKDKDPEPPTYNKEANVTTLNNAAEKFESAIANHTETVTIELDDSLIALLQSAELEVGELPTITLKTDKANNAYAMSIPGIMDGIVAGNYNASRFADENEYWNINPNTGVEVVGSMLDSIDLNALQEFAFTLNDEAVTVETVNGVEVVSVDLDLHVLINKLLTTIKTNKDAPIINLINGLLADFGVENTIAEIVADLKTEVTETTTIKQVVTLALSKLGIDLNVDTLLENIKDIMELTTGIEYQSEHDDTLMIDDYSFVAFSKFYGYGTEMIDGIAQMLEAPVLAAMDITTTEWADGLDMFVTTLSSEDLTLVNTIVKLIVGDPTNYETEEEYLDAVEAAVDKINDMFDKLNAISINDLSVVINLETQNNVAKGYSIDLNAAVAITMPVGESSINVGLTLDADFSNIGTTTIAIPTTGADYEGVILTVSAADITAGEALVIDDVVIHTMDEFTTSTNNEVKFEEGTLTISAQVINEFLANVDAKGSDMILIFTDQDADGEDANAKELTIAIRIIVEAADVE